MISGIYQDALFPDGQTEGEKKLTADVLLRDGLLCALSVSRNPFVKRIFFLFFLISNCSNPILLTYIESSVIRTLKNKYT